jgi:hypothetical protein
VARLELDPLVQHPLAKAGRQLLGEILHTGHILGVEPVGRDRPLEHEQHGDRADLGHQWRHDRPRRCLWGRRRCAGQRIEVDQPHHSVTDQRLPTGSGRRVGHGDRERADGMHGGCSVVDEADERG